MNDSIYTYVPIVNIIIAFLVLKSAWKRRLKAASSWFVMSLLLGPFGWLGYYFMIVRPDKHDC
ncbi:hypothetical protein IPO96_00985 [Candidatus Saccharibacteria bacterium]|nr:MAG: hypothetical protein IPO96_00985 [Candidatus Saccharibacteria bacterium]